MTHLLVTNDFPPKLGGIQSYLFDLWSRLDPDRFVVLTHDEEGAKAFDAQQRFRVERLPEKMLLPTPALRRRIDALANECDASLVVLDPALPLGAIGRHLERPYAVVIHGAEVTVPARLPLVRHLLADVLRRSSLVIAAGGYPLAEAKLVCENLPPSVLVPPSVDAERYRPLLAEERRAVRRSFGIDDDALFVLSFSRLVPRKGMDVLIEASSLLREEFPALTVAIGGTGRDVERLERLIEEHHAPVRMLGRVDASALPSLTAAADVFAMLCRDRWMGLEQEGFGIVFLEAAAAGVPQVAGRSGGTTEAVIDGSTGLVVDRPGDVVAATSTLRRLLGDAELRARLGAEARRRVEADFDLAALARRMGEALERFGG